MIINHLPDKTELIPSKHDGFMLVALMAVREAENRKLPCIFMFSGRLITVNDGDKATQVYSTYLKRCNTTPTSIADSLDDIKCGTK